MGRGETEECDEVGVRGQWDRLSGWESGLEEVAAGLDYFIHTLIPWDLSSFLRGSQAPSGHRRQCWLQPQSKELWQPQRSLAEVSPHFSPQRQGFKFSLV